jgi:hypothetical protein
MNNIKKYDRMMIATRLLEKHVENNGFTNADYAVERARVWADLLLEELEETWEESLPKEPEKCKTT